MIRFYLSRFVPTHDPRARCLSRCASPFRASIVFRAQAIGCGEHAGIELGALRICASARAVVSATSRGDAELGQALSALDKTAAIVRHLRFC
jgi:hypothetical protein